MGVKCKLFDSWDRLDLVDEIWDNWYDWFEDEEKPDNRPDSRLWDEAWEYTNMDYQDLVLHLKHKGPDDRPMLLFGSLGLWWGHPTGYKYVTRDDALDWLYDEMSVYYEDGDIVVRHYHHDGTNEFCLMMLKDWEDVNVKDFSDEELKEVEETYEDISHGYGLEDYEMKWVKYLLTSVAPYFKDYLNREAFEDLAHREEALVGQLEEED